MAEQQFSCSCVSNFAYLVRFLRFMDYHIEKNNWSSNIMLENDMFPKFSGYDLHELPIYVNRFVDCFGGEQEFEKGDDDDRDQMMHHLKRLQEKLNEPGEPIRAGDINGLMEVVLYGTLCKRD